MASSETSRPYLARYDGLFNTVSAYHKFLEGAGIKSAVLVVA